MWEEGKGGGKPKDFFVRASWYFRPKDVPKPVLATALGPKGKASPKELFASAMTEENDVRSVISLAQIGSVPKQAAEMADNEYVCRYEYFPLERRLKPRKESAPSTRPSGDSSTGSRPSAQVEVSTTAEAVAPVPAGSNKSAKKTTASAGPASASTASAKEKVVPQSSDQSSSQSSSGSKGKGRSLPALETPQSPDQSLLVSASGEGGGEDSKSSEVAATDTGGPVLLSPKTGPAKIERSRVGDAYQATVPALVGEKTRKSPARNEPTASGEQLMECVWEPSDDPNDPLQNDAAIRSFLARAHSVHGLQPGDIVRILEGETEDTSAASSQVGGVESGGSIDGADNSLGGSSSSSSSSGGGGMSRNGSSGSISDSAKPTSSAASSETAGVLRLKLPSTPLALQWGVFLGDADSKPNAASSSPLTLPPPEPHTTATEDGGASEVPAEASAGAVAGAADPSASAADGAVSDPAPLAVDAAVGVAGSTEPVERAVRVVYLNRATSSKSRSIVPLRKVRGRFNEAAALECLRTAHMDPEAALKLWTAQLAREEPPLRTWTAEEVRILNSAVGRFGDDFRDICAFLPGKDQAAVAQLYYTFWGPARSGDAAVQLFRLAESHRLESTASGSSSGGDVEAGHKRQLTGQDAKESGSGIGDVKRPRPSESTSKGRGAKGLAADNAASASATAGAGASVNGSSSGRAGKKQRVVAAQRPSEAPWRGGASSSRRSGSSKATSAAAAETNTDSEDETDDEVGRLAASQRFLKAAHGSMPPAQYAQLVELLVRFDSANISMSKLLAEVTRLIHPYPKLEMGFHPFLPPSWNMNGPAAM